MSDAPAGNSSVPAGGDAMVEALRRASSAITLSKFNAGEGARCPPRRRTRRSNPLSDASWTMLKEVMPSGLTPQSWPSK